MRVLEIIVERNSREDRPNFPIVARLLDCRHAGYGTSVEEAIADLFTASCANRKAREIERHV